MNTYKYKAYMEIKTDITSLEKCIAEKSTAIEKKKEEISQLEKEIKECEKRLDLAVDFKNELENGVVPERTMR